MYVHGYAGHGDVDMIAGITICDAMSYIPLDRILIEPGIKWEDIPTDFECPLCMVGKDQFSEE